jgi:TIR domain
VRVFISWSGEPSRSIAGALNDWIESILSQIDTWTSDDEIRSGARWSLEVAKALDASDFGIICVTRENQHTPWLIFEAGALAKKLDTGRVVPLCIDLPPTDVTEPLSTFQGRALDEAGVRRLVHDLNKETEKPLDNGRLDRVLDKSWPELEEAIAAAVEGGTSAQEPQRKPEDMLAEVVETVRRIERSVEEYGFLMVTGDTRRSRPERVTSFDVERVREILRRNPDPRMVEDVQRYLAWILEPVMPKGAGPFEVVVRPEEDSEDVPPSE